MNTHFVRFLSERSFSKIVHSVKSFVQKNCLLNRIVRSEKTIVFHKLDQKSFVHIKRFCYYINIKDMSINYRQNARKKRTNFWKSAVKLQNGVSPVASLNLRFNKEKEIYTYINTIVLMFVQ